MHAPEAAEVTAFHEAGHVVARMVRGMPAFRYVTLNPRGATSCGIVATRSPPPVVQPTDAVISTLAGPMAQAYWHWLNEVGAQVLGEDDEGMTFPDYLCGAFLIGGDGDAEAYDNGGEFIAQLHEAPTLALVRQHWAAIETLARALLERTTMTHAEVRILLPDLPRYYAPPENWDGLLVLSPVEEARIMAARALVKKSDPTYPVDSCREDDSHYGFGHGADLADSGFRRTFPLVDKRTGEVTWLRGTRGSKRLERMRPVVKTP